MTEVLLITNDDGYTEVYNFKAFWRLGPHKIFWTLFAHSE